MAARNSAPPSPVETPRSKPKDSMPDAEPIRGKPYLQFQSTISTLEKNHDSVCKNLGFMADMLTQCVRPNSRMEERSVATRERLEATFETKSRQTQDQLETLKTSTQDLEARLEQPRARQGSSCCSKRWLYHSGPVAQIQASAESASACSIRIRPCTPSICPGCCCTIIQHPWPEHSRPSFPTWILCCCCGISIGSSHVVNLGRRHPLRHEHHELAHPTRGIHHQGSEYQP